jgi:hypothetical protein
VSALVGRIPLIFAPELIFKSKDDGWIIFIFCDNDSALQHDERLCE